MHMLQSSLIGVVGYAAAIVGCQSEVGLRADAVADVPVPDVLHPHDHQLPPPPDALADAPEEVRDAGPLDDGDVVADAAETPEDTPRDRSRDLEVRWTGFERSAGRLAQVRLIAGDGRLLAEATLDTLVAGSDGFTLEGAVPSPGMRLDGWIDQNDNRLFDGPAIDQEFHARVPDEAPHTVAWSPSDATGDAGVGGVIEAGDLSLRFLGFEPHVGFPLIVTVTVARSDQQVGLLRVSSLPSSGEVNFTFRGVIGGAPRYTAFWFLDLNRNGVFDRYGDHFATLTGSPNAHGFIIHHDHHTNTTWQE